MEVWKKISGFGGLYEVSNMGNVRVKDRTVYKSRGINEKIMKQKYKGRDLIGARNPNQFGYCKVTLTYDGCSKGYNVHRLVLSAFIGDCPDGFECCHKNGIPHDNRLDNLRWDSHYNNNQDRKKHGNYSSGTNHHFSKFSQELIDKIKNKIITKKEALDSGVSNTHYYRILKGAKSEKKTI